MQSLLAQVRCIVRQDGWCSRGEARNSLIPKLATVDQALLWFNPKFVEEQRGPVRAKYAPTDDDTAEASAIAWAQSLPADIADDYLWNIRVVAHKEYVDARGAGLAGSIISAHNRHVERELARKYESQNPSEYASEREFVEMPNWRALGRLTPSGIFSTLSLGGWLVVGTGRTPVLRRRRELRRQVVAKAEPSPSGRKILIPRRVEVFSPWPDFLGKDFGRRSFDERDPDSPRESRARWRSADRCIFPAGARQPDDAAHAAITVPDPAEKPMNAGARPSRHPGGGLPGTPRRPRIQQNRGALQIPAQSPEYFGTPEVRDSFRLTVVGMRETEGDYGLTTMVRFRQEGTNNTAI